MLNAYIYERLDIQLQGSAISYASSFLDQDVLSNDNVDVGLLLERATNKLFVVGATRDTHGRFLLPERDISAKGA